MAKSYKLIFISGVLFLSSSLLFVQQVFAGEYVPPPTGPYKSSVVVNKNQITEGNSGQVYKFPSDNLIQSESRNDPVFLSDRRIINLPEKKFSNSAQSIATQQAVSEAEIQHQQQSVVSRQSSQPPSSAAPNFTNPWDPESLPQAENYQQNYYQGDVFRDNYYQGNRYAGNTYPRTQLNSQYAYPQNYPYAQSNQNNFMNAPFNGMPSPWSSMPMQPFFSGR